MNSPISCGPLLHCFADSGEMYRALADEIVTRLGRGVAARDAASLVVPGGSTPIGLFDVLAELEAPWNRVFVTLTDERWVAPTANGSNERQVRARLLRANAAAARLVPLKTDDPTVREAEPRVHGALLAMPRPFDVTVLGMGVDGHFASLFPGADNLREALDPNGSTLACAISPPNLAKTGERLSLTLAALLGSRLLVVLTKGDAKLAAYREALAGDNAQDMPVRAVLHQQETPVQVFWAP